jgi:hypothetical protein
MPVTSRQAFRLGFDDVEDLFVKSLDHFLGIDRTDAADHPGSEVFFDAVDRRRRRGAHEARLELLTVSMVVDPFPRSRNPLACRDHGGVADYRDEVTMSACLSPQNTKAVIAVMERDALDEAGQHFLSCRFRLVPRRSAHDVPSSVAVNNFLMVANCPARLAIVVGLSRIRSSSPCTGRFLSCSSRSTRAMCVFLFPGA